MNYWFQNYNLRCLVASRIHDINLPTEALVEVMLRLYEGDILVVDYRESSSKDPTGVKALVTIMRNTEP